MAQSGTTVQTDAYDGDGSRVTQTTGSSTFTYSYQGVNILYEKNVTSGATTVTKRFYAGGVQVAEMVNSSVYYLHQDALGSTRLETTSTVTVRFGSNYMPYGPSFGAPGREEAMYTGKTYDGATGLYYEGARYYYPSTGRFVTEDSYPGNNDDPMSLNRYVYSRDNPEGYTDPNGHYYAYTTGVVTNAQSVCQADSAACVVTSVGTSAGSAAATPQGPPDVVLAQRGNAAASGEDLTLQQRMNLAGVSGTSFYGGVSGSNPSLTTGSSGVREVWQLRSDYERFCWSSNTCNSGINWDQAGAAFVLGWSWGAVIGAAFAGPPGWSAELPLINGARETTAYWAANGDDPHTVDIMEAYIAGLTFGFFGGG